ncbi:nuclear pore complex protein nup93 [Anaeramoeba ignava]|uniref:Nuclear pore protein n=1 Tax=Anaeramoeba ignava TaxID=1746090 RepID=A0A9Q0RI40_ANAIG|nr:nuclear pore complex protein nup93 [Anaeramoeba ignava]
MDFGNLLNQAEKLNLGINQTVPFVDRFINQTHHQSVEIEKKNQRVHFEEQTLTQKAIKAKAYGLLPEEFDQERMNRKLQYLQQRSAQNGRNETNSSFTFEEYLNFLHLDLIFSVNQDVKKETTNLVKNRLSQKSQNEWNEIISSNLDPMIINHLSNTLNQNQSFDNEQTNFQENSKTFIDSPIYLETEQLNTSNNTQKKNTNKLKLSSQMIEYSQVVEKMNEIEKGKEKTAKKIDIVQMMIKATQNSSFKMKKKSKQMNTSREIEDIWKMCDFLISNGLILSDSKDPKNPKEKSKNNLEKLAQISRLYLEQQYIQYLVSLSSNVPYYSNITDNDSQIPFEMMLKIFCHKKLFNHEDNQWDSSLSDIIDDFPLWPQIYLCLRTGNYSSINRIINSLSQTTKEIEKIGQLLTNISNEHKNQNSLPKYKNLSKSNDPYKQAIYNILCGTEVYKISILNNIEDWIWYKLFILHQQEKSGRARISLSQIQETIQELGESHFINEGGSPFKYFRILILTLQFEYAIAYLYSKFQYETEAIHFAIALNYYNLILTKSEKKSTQKHTLSTPGNLTFSKKFGSAKKFMSFITPNKNKTPKSQFSQSKSIEIIDENVLLKMDSMIYYYIQKFPSENLKQALNYLILIQDPNLRQRGLNEILQQVANMEQIFGSFSFSEQNLESSFQEFDFKSNILHDMFLINEESIMKIMENCAFNLENQGKIIESIILFHRARNYHRVVEMLIKYLSLELSGKKPEKLDSIFLFARIIDSYYNIQNPKDKKFQIDEKMKKSFKLLLNLVDFFEFYFNGEYGKALQLLEDLQFIPTHLNQLTYLLQEITGYHESIFSCLPEVLLTLMTIIYKMFLFFQEAGEIKMVQSLREKAKCLPIFAIRIPIKIPNEILTDLNRMNVLMK